MLNQEEFDLWADDYDRTVGLSDEAQTYPFAGYREVLGRIFRIVLEKPGASVLDVGFGTGTLAAALYQRGCVVCGQDFSPRMIALAAESYLMDARNIIINGYTGAGKTYLSCAIAKEACRRLHKTRYVRMPKMLEEFNLATQTGSGISKLVKRYSTYHLLIVDEWLVEIPSEMEVKYLLEIFEIRYDLYPTIFCTQYKQSEWHPRLGGGVMADAIMDRIVHNADTVDLGKVNMRELLARKQG